MSAALVITALRPPDMLKMTSGGVLTYSGGVCEIRGGGGCTNWQDFVSVGGGG